MYLSSSSVQSPDSPRWSQVHLPNGSTVAAEVMRTPAERAAGMQLRNRFPKDTVMLFVHPTEGRYTYHMTNVGFPLEILFFRSDLRLASVQHAQPGHGSYAGNGKVVIEAPSGFASENNLKIGDLIRWG